MVQAIFSLQEGEMKTKATLAAAVGAVVLMGGTVMEVRKPEMPTADDASYLKALLNPVEIGRQLCSGSTSDGYAARRAPFLRFARLHAAEASAEEMARTAPPLWDGLGPLDISITTDNPQSQAYFNQGMRIANDFNHVEAIRSFRWAQHLDTQCAMCYWGEALALGPNINAPMDGEAAPLAYAAIRKALSLAANVSDKEKALIKALETRYGREDLTLRAQYDNAYAKAMQAVAEAYPEDNNILALAAEAMMDAQPWDYWEADYRTPKGRTTEVLALLETVLERDPEHPTAIHLYIHVTEASNDPYRAEKGAERLSSLAPAAGHLVHMPSHTFHRVGRYIDAYRVNVAAMEANEAYFAESQASALYEYGYYTHNVHSALTSAQMAGDAKAALSLATKLDQKMPAEMVRLAPWVQAIKVAPYFAYVQFGADSTVMKLEDPGSDFPYLQAMWRYARGEAMARQGDLKAALQEANAAEALADNPVMKDLSNNGLPAPALAHIAAEVVRARVDIRNGDMKSALHRLENATVMQDEMFYSEPSFWYFPVRQMLGATLLMDGQAHRAEAVFIRSLVDAPNNAWALFGLREAEQELGNEAAAKYADTLFRQAWLGNADELELSSL
jgi:tetratricopeptide (TPR) repeat protein